MDQMQNIVGALQGLGAGLQGQLPQFLSQQNQQQGLQQQNELRGLQMQQIREQMTAERQKTMFVDAQSALKLVEAGNIDGVVRLGLNRLQMLKQMSAQDPSIDPSDTQRITQLAIAAKNGSEEALENLRGELTSTVDVGKSIGVLETEKKSGAATDIGKLAQDLANGFITQEQYDQMVSSDELMSPSKNVQRSVEVPGQGFNKVYEDGSTEFSPYSVEQATAYAKSQEMEIEHAENQINAETASRMQAEARQALRNTVNEGALAAREAMPRLDRMLELADIASTGTFGEIRTDVARIFGRAVEDEEEFMALANQEILAAASALKGALSDRENAYLEAVGPGIGKSREGNKRIISNIMTIANNAIARQRALRDFRGDPSEFYFEGQAFNDTSESIEDGTIIENDAGESMIYRNGQWVPY